MTEEIEAHVLKKYEILQKLGKLSASEAFENSVIALHTSSFQVASLVNFKTTTWKEAEYEIKFRAVSWLKKQQSQKFMQIVEKQRKATKLNEIRQSKRNINHNPNLVLHLNFQFPTQKLKFIV